MSLKELLKKPMFKVLTNKYILVTAVFIIWMIFFDENSWLNHQRLNREINDLTKEQKYYKTQIEKDKKIINDLKSDKSAEKFAREEYKMKKKDEDIYIIKYDTLPKK